MRPVVRLLLDLVCLAFALVEIAAAEASDVASALRWRVANLKAATPASVWIMMGLLLPWCAKRMQRTKERARQAHADSIVASAEAVANEGR